MRYEIRDGFRATGKHVMGGVNDIGGFSKVLEMASMLAGSKEKVIAKPVIFFIGKIPLAILPFAFFPTREDHKQEHLLEA